MNAFRPNMNKLALATIQLRQNLVRWLAITLLATTAIGCDGSSTNSTDDDRIVEGVNLTTLFKAPTVEEEDSVLADWGSRSYSASGVQVASQTAISLGGTAATLRVVSHSSAGAIHYGAILSPDNAEAQSLPIIVYLHGGDNGVDISELLDVLPIALGSAADDYVYLVPSFRSEQLRYGGATYTSTGAASPWDRDVDDALSLTNVAISLTSSADPERIGVVGFSRGACVGMLMGIRDSRIDLVIEFFGPTDFFSPFTEEIFADALTGSLADLPGLSTLNEDFIQPLKAGSLTPAQFRLEMLRRSPVYFVDLLPPTQAHHGALDNVVPVSEAERLRGAFGAGGLGSPDYTIYVYANGGHNPVTLFGSFDRARSFLERLSNPPAAITSQREMAHD